MAESAQILPFVIANRIDVRGKFVFIDIMLHYFTSRFYFISVCKNIGEGKNNC